MADGGFSAKSAFLKFSPLLIAREASVDAVGTAVLIETSQIEVKVKKKHMLNCRIAIISCSLHHSSITRYHRNVNDERHREPE